MLNVNVGDNVVVYNQDVIGNAGAEEYSLPIAGIVENYVAHYVYMKDDVYKKLFNRDPVFSNVILKLDANLKQQQDITNKIKQTGNVKSTFFTETNRETYTKMLSSVNMVVLVLIISAALLAFVVLFNLININIRERSREIATLKVLGCNKHEINMYICRETFLLSLMGAILGIIFGFFLEGIVITSAEVDYVMFGRNIY